MSKAATRSRRRIRSIVALVLVVLASFSIVAASIDLWNRYLAQMGIENVTVASPVPGVTLPAR